MGFVFRFENSGVANQIPQELPISFPTPSTPIAHIRAVTIPQLR